ncbi:MAG: hypothetical protein ABEK02_01940 [Haloquadratum sp.]
MNERLLRVALVVGLVVSTAGAATAAGASRTAASEPGESASAIDAEVGADRAAVAPALGGRPVDAALNASDPQSSGEFLAAFRELSGRESLVRYSEFEVLRTQAIVAVQAGDFTAADRKRMRAVLRTLVQFDHAYRAAANGSLAEGLRYAKRTQQTISDLEAAGGTQYSSLASVALDRFFRSLGQRFERKSRGEEISTPAQITALRRAAKAYRLGGASDQFAKMSVRAEQLASRFQRDQRVINESLAAAQQFFERCGEACSSPVSAIAAKRLAVFGLYVDARAASAASARAVQIARTHNLGERTEQLQALSERSGAMLLSLTIASALLFLAYGLVVAIPTMLVASRLSLWATDRAAADVGSVLTPMPTEVRADGGE